MTDTNSDNTPASPKPAKDHFVCLVLLAACLLAPALSFAIQAYGAILGGCVYVILYLHWTNETPTRRLLKSIGYGIGILALAIMLTPALRIVYSYISGYVTGFFGGFFG